MEASVVLILDQPEQMTGSGCCGKVGRDAKGLCGVDVFDGMEETRRHFGVLHRAVREFFPEDRVEIVTVDPRNQPYLWPKLWADVWRYRPGWKAGAATVFECFSLPAVVVNGRVVSKRGELLAPDALCHWVAKALGREEEPDEAEGVSQNRPE